MKQVVNGTVPLLLALTFSFAEVSYGGSKLANYHGNNNITVTAGTRPEVGRHAFSLLPRLLQGHPRFGLIIIILPSARYSIIH